MSEIVDVIINVDDKATQKLMQVGERLSSIGQYMTRVFTMPLQQLGRTLMQNKDVQAALKPVQAAFGQIYAQLAKEVIPIIKELTPTLIALSKTLVDLVKQIGPVLRELTPVFKEFVAQIGMVVKWFGSLSPETKKMIVDFLLFAAVLGPILTSIGQFLLTLGKLGSLLPGISSGLASIGTTVLPALGTMFGAITLPVLALVAAIALLIGTIVTLGPSAWETLQYMGKIAVIVFNSMIATIRNFGLSILRFDWVGLGRNIILGIMNGIKSAAGGLVSALKSTLDAAIAAAKKALGIASPSKIFMGIGANMMGGLSAGVTQAAPGAINATRSAVKATTQGHSGSVNVGNIYIGDVNNMTRNDIIGMTAQAFSQSVGKNGR